MVIKLRKEIIINNLIEMEELAKDLSNKLFPGFVLCLEGDLGAGKTTFTKYLGKHMGIKDTINSPTFTILKIYEHTLPLYHMDVYRLQGIGADYDLEEYIYDDGVCVIEWYHHIEESLPEAFLSMTITIDEDNKRRIMLEGSDQYEAIISSLNY